MHLRVLRKCSPRKIIILLRFAFTQSIKNAFTVRCKQFWHNRFFKSPKLFLQGIWEICPKDEMQGLEKSACQNLFDPAFVWLRPAASIFRVFRQISSCKMRILLQLALTKSIKKYNAGGCCAVLREQIFRRCKEKMRSNIRYCEYFFCSRCRYLPLKTVWVRLSSAIANTKKIGLLRYVYSFWRYWRRG